MDTATLLNIKPDPVKKTESLAANTSDRSNTTDKSQESFKSAYKKQLKAEPGDKHSEESRLPHNGNGLPDQEASKLPADQSEGTDQTQVENTPSGTEQGAYEINKSNNIQESVLVEENFQSAEEGTYHEDGAISSLAAVQLTDEQKKGSALEVSSEQKATVTKDKTESLIPKLLNSFQGSLKNNQSEMSVAVKSGMQDGARSGKEPAFGQSIVDFQQYMESSRNKALNAQPITSIKNFEKILKSEQLNGQILQADKSASLNQIPASISTSNINNLTSSASMTSVQGLSSAMAGFDIKPGVGKPGWSQAFNNQIMIMAGNGIQQAKLKLNPVHLGPVEVNIRLTKEKAVINLSSVQISTRDAIDGAIPRLKEMLNENGFSQVDVNVSHQDKQAQQEAANLNRSSAQERSDNEHGNSTMPGDEQLSEPGDEPENDSLLSKNLAQSLNIVDYYA